MLIAGPNLTTDRDMDLDELRPGHVLRARAVRVAPGGKGLNVARSAGDLGLPAALIAFVPGAGGELLAAGIRDEGVELHGVPCAGEPRSTAVVHECGGRVTVVNEPGPPIDAAAWDAFRAAARTMLHDHSVLVCSGSLPPGAPEDGYARLGALADRWVLDTAGSALAAALAAGPDVVKVNAAEVEAALHGRGGAAVEAGEDAPARARRAAADLLAAGARAAVGTAGGAGVAFATPGVAGFLAAPRVTVRNPIGAGDAFTAALAGALERGLGLEDAVRAGAAAGAASVEAPAAGRLDPARAAELLRELRG
jgi:1-phosphofructokinase family hexose kinase